MSAFNKLLVCLAVDTLLVVELFVAFGAFHFAPKEDAHNGSLGSPVLDVLKEGVEFGGSHDDDGWGWRGRCRR